MKEIEATKRHGKIDDLVFISADKVWKQYILAVPRNQGNVAFGSVPADQSPARERPLSVPF